MTEQTMVERVARSMERARKPQWDDAQFEIWWNADPFFCDGITSWGYFTGTRKGRCLFEARAAIEEMREPTAAMLCAAENGLFSLRTYRMVIDAALAEP